MQASATSNYLHFHDNVFGRKVRDARIGAGLTQVALAKKIGIDNTEVSKLETGKLLPSDKILHAFAKALKIPVEDLVSRPPPVVSVVPAPAPEPVKEPAPEPAPEPVPVEAPAAEALPVAELEIERLKSEASKAGAQGALVRPPSLSGYERLPGVYLQDDVSNVITSGATKGGHLWSYIVLPVGKAGSEPMFAVYRAAVAPAVRR